jgi:hypothetical protein
MIDREEHGAAEDGSPSTPLAVKRAVEQAAEEELLGKRRHQRRDGGNRLPQMWDRRLLPFRLCDYRRQARDPVSMNLDWQSVGRRLRSAADIIWSGMLP